MIVWFALTTATVWVTRRAAAKLALPAWSAWITQDPVALNVTRLAAPSEHTELEPEPMEKVTVNPDVAVADGVYVVPTGGFDGAVEVKEMVCDARGAATTFTVWDTCGAALKLALPAWSAWMTQDPVELNVTRLAPPIEHTALELPAMEKVTGRPEVAVAVGV